MKCSDILNPMIDRSGSLRRREARKIRSIDSQWVHLLIRTTHVSADRSLLVAGLLELVKTEHHA